MKIYSKVEPSKLLHVIVVRDLFRDARKDISDPEQFLQVAALRLNEGDTFKAHKHVPCSKLQTITQESWVVIRGEVLVQLFDIDDELLVEEILCPGDLSITFYGGHNYRALEYDTLVYEFKTGPYEGQVADKEFI